MIPLSNPSPSVLVVDDDPEVLASLVDELSEHYEVTSSENGEAAWDLICQHDFDAVIADVRMPGMDGVELLRRVQRADSETVRILLTGYSDDFALQAACLNEGAYKLAKPWGDELEITLKRALEHQQRTRQLRTSLEVERHAKARAELALYKLDKVASLGTLARGIAHEMRSPLTYLMSNLGWLEEELARLDQAAEAMGSALTRSSSNQHALEALRKIWEDIQPRDALDELKNVQADCLAGVRRLENLLNSVHSYGTNDAVTRHQRIDLAEVIRKSIRLVGCNYKHKVKVITEFDSEHAFVVGHEGEISQVLINVLLNAIQAMEGEGQVTFRLSSRNAKHIVEIEDDGPGVEQGAVPRIFEAFFTTRNNEGSNGLGLSVSREIAQRHGGDLRHVGQRQHGAVFALELPADPTRPHQAPLVLAS